MTRDQRPEAFFQGSLTLVRWPRCISLQLWTVEWDTSSAFRRSMNGIHQTRPWTHVATYKCRLTKTVVFSWIFAWTRNNITFFSNKCKEFGGKTQLISMVYSEFFTEVLEASLCFAFKLLFLLRNLSITSGAILK